MLCMESEDEEFEQLLEEIPRAMETPTEGDQQDPAQDGGSMADEAFCAEPELEPCKEDSAHSTKTIVSDCIVNTNMGLQLPLNVLDDGEQFDEFEQRQTAADVSLPLMFADLKLQVGAGIQPNLPLLHPEVSAEMPPQVSSTWASETSSFGHTLKNLQEVPHAIPGMHELGVPRNGANTHAHGRFAGLQRADSVPYMCDIVFNRKENELDPGIDGLHRVLGLSVKPSSLSNYQVAAPYCNQQARLVPRCYWNGKGCWHLNSRVVPGYQARQIGKLNPGQDGMNIDHMCACCAQDVVDVRYCSGTPAPALGREYDYSCPKDSGTYGSLSCGHPFRQRPTDSYVDNICTYCTQDIHSKEYACSTLHDMFGDSAMSKAYQVGSAAIGSGLLKAPTGSVLCNEKAPLRILPRKSTRVVVPTHSPTMRCCPVNGANVSKEKFEGNQHSTIGLKNSFKQENLIKAGWVPPKGDWLTEALQQQPFFSWSTLADIEGCVLAVAKDQHGCRFLQRKFDEGSPQDVQKIFEEVVHNVVDLMVDPFGNYLVQKLFEVCTDEQRSDLLRSITNNGGLVNVSLNIHGTRAVQKLVETLKSWEHVAIVTASLRSGVVTLIKDLNGNHVIQRCLQHLSNEHNEFIFEAAAKNCVEIATHRHGCCVLQRCIDHSSGPARQKLIWEVASNSLQLAQDSFGNYVVQYILDLGLPWAIQEVVNCFVENYVSLSMQKFSSNVVERCLRLCREESKVHIIRELIDSSQFVGLLQDRYANYVIQSALMVSKGALHATIVEAIRPHIPSLRNNPYGKRILSRRNFKKS